MSYTLSSTRVERIEDCSTKEKFWTCEGDWVSGKLQRGAPPPKQWLPTYAVDEV